MKKLIYTLVLLITSVAFCQQPTSDQTGTQYNLKIYGNKYISVGDWTPVTIALKTGQTTPFLNLENSVYTQLGYINEFAQYTRGNEIDVVAYWGEGSDYEGFQEFSDLTANDRNGIFFGHGDTGWVDGSYGLVESFHNGTTPNRIFSSNMYLESYEGAYTNSSYVDITATTRENGTTPEAYVYLRSDGKASLDIIGTTSGHFKIVGNPLQGDHLLTMNSSPTAERFIVGKTGYTRINNGDASQEVLRLRGASGQTAPFLNFQTSTPTQLGYVNEFSQYVKGNATHVAAYWGENVLYAGLQDFRDLSTANNLAGSVYGVGDTGWVDGGYGYTKAYASGTVPNRIFHSGCTVESYADSYNHYDSISLTTGTPENGTSGVSAFSIYSTGTSTVNIVGTSTQTPDLFKVNNGSDIFNIEPDGTAVVDHIQLSGNSNPITCDASARGTARLIKGGVGVADTSEMCMKNSTDTYQWVTIVTAP